MTKTTAVKGMAAKALQPISPVAPEANAAAKALQPTAAASSEAKAVISKAPRSPPPKARGVRPEPAAAKAAPRPKQTAAELENAIANAAELPPKKVKSLLEALRDVAAKSLRETHVFKLPGVVLIRLRKTPARERTTRSIFGKDVVLRERPVGQKITAVAMKPLYTAVSAGE